MKKLLNVAAAAEASMGVALLAIPSLVGRLLLGAELIGIGLTVARVTGIALIGLAVACGPGTPLVGMLTYSALTTLYFVSATRTPSCKDSRRNAMLRHDQALKEGLDKVAKAGFRAGT